MVWFLPSISLNSLLTIRMYGMNFYVLPLSLSLSLSLTHTHTHTQTLVLKISLSLQILKFFSSQHFSPYLEGCLCWKKEKKILNKYLKYHMHRNLKWLVVHSSFGGTLDSGPWGPGCFERWWCAQFVLCNELGGTLNSYPVSEQRSKE